MKPFVTAAVLMASVAWSASARCQPTSLDDPLHCNVSARQFVGDMIDHGLIEPQPFRVESNSINAFNPMHGVDLRAFGFHVFAIVGYEEGSSLFRKGGGKRVSSSAYGAVVWGSTAKVQEAVTAARSPAIVHHAGPLITAIFCDREP